jgi:hypothetical protein
MTLKPSQATGYSQEQASLVKQMCLYIATKLGDIMDDLVIIGGLVPSLLIDQDTPNSSIEPHVGTLDLDIGLQVALLEEERYKTLSERLRQAGFINEQNDNRQPLRQRWCCSQSQIAIDFLIAPTLPDDRGGKLRHLEQDFAAIIAPGLQTAFVDRQQIHLKGHTIFHKQAEREIWVCGPGAYIVLKALAFTNRGENKDAYDLYYVLKYYGDDIEDIIPAFHMIQTTPDAQLAISVLERDFTDHQQIGPRRVAMFLTGGVDMKIQQDVVGYISMFLEKIKIEK